MHWDVDVTLKCLAGMELIFFRAAHMVLEFGFVSKTHQSFGFYWIQWKGGESGDINGVSVFK